MLPNIAFRLETTSKLGNGVRRETRNATSLAQAYALLEREMRKPLTRRCELLMVIDSRDRDSQTANDTI